MPDPKDPNKITRKPCDSCPFARATDIAKIGGPGRVGGSGPERYLGQAYGPFFLACHTAKGYSATNPTMDQVPCAGAAIFRANTGRDKVQPKDMPCADADRDLVFATPAELYACHMKVDSEVAETWLSIVPPLAMMTVELEDANTRVLPGKKGG